MAGKESQAEEVVLKMWGRVQSGEQTKNSNRQDDGLEKGEELKERVEHERSSLTLSSVHSTINRMDATATASASNAAATTASV